MKRLTQSAIARTARWVTAAVADVTPAGTAGRVIRSTSSSRVIRSAVHQPPSTSSATTVILMLGAFRLFKTFIYALLLRLLHHARHNGLPKNELR